MPYHLTETEIQALIDEGKTSPHLSSCESCRAIYQQYRSLYGQLSKPPDWTLPDDFAKHVALRAFPKRVSVWPSMVKSILILAGCAAALLLVQNFIGVVFSRRGSIFATTLLHSTWDVILSALKMPQSVFGKGSGMVFQAGFILLMLSVLDRLWRRSRERRPEPYSGSAA